MRGLAQVGGVCVALGLLACGSRSDVRRGSVASETTDGSGLTSGSTTGARRWPARCVDDWQTLFEQDDVTLARPLALAGGEVVFGLLALSVRPPRLEIGAVGTEVGSASRLITRAFYEELWVERDRLLYWNRNQLFDVPLSGGRPALVLDARGSTSGRLGTALVSPAELFWTQPSADGSLMEVWRRDRDSGDSDDLFALDGETFSGSELALGSDELVVGSGGQAVAIPLEGGSARPLAIVMGGDLLGVGGRGAYYERLANESIRGGEAHEYEIWRAPVDGGPAVRIWSGAAGKRMNWISEAEGGWLATGAYHLGGGPPRAVIVFISAAGREHVLACHPDADTFARRPILTEDALYVATARGNLGKIAKISLIQ